MANSSDRVAVSSELVPQSVITTTLDFMAFDADGYLISTNDTFMLSVTGCTSNYARQVILTSAGQANVVEVNCP